MIFQAAKDFSLNPRECFMVGDRKTDVEAGRNAGCKTILVRTGNGTDQRNADANPDYICENLLEAAELIIKTYKAKMRV